MTEESIEGLSDDELLDLVDKIEGLDDEELPDLRPIEARKKIIRFISKKGSFGIVAEISAKGSQRVEIVDALEIHISHKTVDNRLEEAIDAELIDKEVKMEDGSAKEIYKFKPAGLALCWKMHKSGYFELYEEYLDLLREFKQKKSMLQLWVLRNDEFKEQYMSAWHDKTHLEPHLEDW